MNDVDVTGRNANPYLALGVRPFINCASVRTAHSGSPAATSVAERPARSSRCICVSIGTRRKNLYMSSCCGRDDKRAARASADASETGRGPGSTAP